MTHPNFQMFCFTPRTYLSLGCVSVFATPSVLYCWNMNLVEHNYKMPISLLHFWMVFEQQKSNLFTVCSLKMLYAACFTGVCHANASSGRSAKWPWHRTASNCWLASALGCSKCCRVQKFIIFSNAEGTEANEYIAGRKNSSCREAWWQEERVFERWHSVIHMVSYALEKTWCGPIEHPWRLQWLWFTLAPTSMSCKAWHLS